MSAHHCHARNCEEKVPPELLMCYAHWMMVPKKIRKQVMATYRPGQCNDKRPSEAWRKAADAAIVAVYVVEQLHAHIGKTIAEMQTPEAKAAVQKMFDATPEELGAAAAAAAKEEAVILKSVVDYFNMSFGRVKVHRCPHCNVWDYALQGNPDPGVYNCDECGLPFEIVGEK
jgi:hypothetical protein